MPVIRNDIRAIIAYSKMLYDFGQQMSFARLYLIHKIKLLEVRENDRSIEISVLRGWTPPLKESPPSFGSVMNKESLQDDVEEEDEEQNHPR